MPVVRFSRDRRGYEHTYLVDVSTRAGKSSSRLLYWFRTPPGVKVGREPFDAEMRRTIEEQYPDLTFDWRTIVATPMPAPSIDWRSRRRADRAAKAAERAAQLEEGGDLDDATLDASTVDSTTVETGGLEPGDVMREDGDVQNQSEGVTELRQPGAPDAGYRPGSGRRRRRRGGRHHRRGMAPSPPIVEKTPESADVGQGEVTGQSGSGWEGSAGEREGAPLGGPTERPPDGER